MAPHRGARNASRGGAFPAPSASVPKPAARVGRALALAPKALSDGGHTHANFRWTRGWIASLATLAVVSILIGVAVCAARAATADRSFNDARLNIHTDIAHHHVDTITIDSSSLTPRIVGAV